MDEILTSPEDPVLLRRYWQRRGLLPTPIEELWSRLIERRDFWKAEARAVAVAQNIDKTTQNPIGKRSSRKPKRRERDVATRRAIVCSNANVTDEEMVQIFDREELALLWNYRDAGFKKWSEAFQNKNYRDRIHTLISKDRRNC